MTSLLDRGEARSKQARDMMDTNFLEGRLEGAQ